ncbi:nucleoside-diphosphate-sugar epimerase [Kineothrix alysoides]|uniref:Nucleoside-diphosphate-sugar epimerase n=1 Tax=Kineothrix alysoides TaxID=1469948 RepID=A0A4R1R1W8_9FIRM|nr:NAD(P)-dependent oxidoreductase [Kineothrix alysoides]TCL59350.1 nucleoside-diphosphate-sugar epimerase [Kineothrix alysoides]
MVKKVCVTGATGFLAVPLIKLCVAKGCKVYAVVRPASVNINRLEGLKNVFIVECEMQDYNLLADKVHDNIDMFFHLSWEGIRGKHRDDEALQYKNYSNSITVLKEAIKLNTKVFVGVGSQAEYGSILGEMQESMEVNPDTEYGRFKCMLCDDGQKISEQNNIRFIWGRIFSAYGIHDTPGSLISSCIEKMRKNEAIELLQGEQDWNYIYVADVAEALWRLGIKQEAKGIFNVASKDNRKLKDYIMELKEILGSESCLKYEALDRHDALRGIRPNIDKLVSTLEWLPGTSFKAGILRCMEGINIANEND